MVEPCHFQWPGRFNQRQTCRFAFDGMVFNCAEQAVMVLKARRFVDEACARRILGAGGPGKQRALGCEVRRFDQAGLAPRRCDPGARISITGISPAL